MKLIPLLGLLLLLSPSVLTNKNYLLGRFNPANDTSFVKLGKEHSSGSAVGGYLRKESYNAFIKMSDAAHKEGIKLVIISATRNFDSQKQIWENKWSGKTLVEGKNLTTIKSPEERARLILRFSSMPGSSRHHWGTDMDLNNLNNFYFESGEGLKMYTWLQAHGAEYGFCQPYTSKSTGRTGYEEEKWHWSYSPLSKQFLEDYVKQVTYEDITGFQGSEAAKKIRIIEEFVGGIGCR